MGTWVHSNVALVFKMNDRGFCQVEERCTGDGSLIASGTLGKQASRDSWRVWNSSRYGDSDSGLQEAFRINESDHDLLEHMLLETWGDWDDAPPLRRCYDEITQQKCSPQTAAPATAVDASPVRLTVLSRDVALAGSGDGYVQLLECGSQSWSRRVGDWLAGATSKFNYGVNVVAFSPDGVYAFLGTTAGTSTDRMRVTDGYVICIRTDDGKEMWSWHARALNNSSALHVKDLSVAPDGKHVAVGFYRESFLGYDGVEMPRGHDYVVYLSVYGDGTLVEDVWRHPETDSLLALAHSPHSVYLAVCLHPGRFALYQDDIACFATNSGHLIWRCRMLGQRLRESKISFSPGGRFILCAALGHSSEENDDFPGSMVAEVDEDDFCTVTCIAIESGQMIWRSKPIPDFSVTSMQLTSSLDGRSILVLCRLFLQRANRPQDQDLTYHGAVVRLDAQTGKPTKKARFSLPDTLQSLLLTQCPDLQVAIAVDAWEGNETAVKIFTLKLCGAPADWIGRDVKSWMYGDTQWPAKVDPQLLWMAIMPEVRHQITSFAFKPEFPVKTQILEELDPGQDEGLVLEEDMKIAAEADQACDPQASSSIPKRRSHHQRQRKKKYWASVQLPTPSSLD